MAKNVQLLDPQTGDKQYPITKASVVYMNDGKTVEATIAELKAQIAALQSK